MAATMRDKRDCMRLGTGLCPRGEKWAANGEPCDDCECYINKEGDTDESA